ncbi:MAG: CRISPR-associated helicase Cas3', partial [Chloroflexota bacterium]
QTLAIVEAPMGEGKTEAGLLLAARLAARGGARGLYFALPTVATSNQMYERVRSHLAGWAGDGERVGLLLINGQAELSPQYAEALAQQRAPGNRDPDDPIEVDSWLLPRKRSLLSPYGVGTVDQAMMAALNVRHVTLRLLGLAGKVVLIDEVHAYDTYMSTVIDRLLAWLRALGASVVLLSATLPSARRRQLVAAFTGREAAATTADEAYPLVTIADADADGPPRRLAVSGVAAAKTVALERRPDGEGERAANARYLVDRLGEGGCACWICNTVDEAQRCYMTLRKVGAALPPDLRPEVLLFHARFPLERRQQIEKEVLGRFGPGGERPRRAVLVATQVVEQSLDLDFDLMATQLAPVDLLLQRLGRLHRHADTPRPAGLASPCLVLLEPPRGGDGGFAFGPYGYVYEPFVLLKTLLALQGLGTVEVPDAVRTLVEAVYDDRPPDEAALAALGLPASALATARRHFDGEQQRMAQEARRRLLGEPDRKGNFHLHPGLRFDEESAERDEWIAAQTRLAEPSARVVLLEQDDRLLATCGLLDEPQAALSVEAVRELMLRSATISKRALVGYLDDATEDPRVIELQGHRALKGYRLLLLTGGEFPWTWHKRDHRLRLLAELGVVIDGEED